MVHRATILSTSWEWLRCDIFLKVFYLRPAQISNYLLVRLFFEKSYMVCLHSMLLHLIPCILITNSSPLTPWSKVHTQYLHNFLCIRVNELFTCLDICLPVYTICGAINIVRSALSCSSRSLLYKQSIFGSYFSIYFCATFFLYYT